MNNQVNESKRMLSAEDVANVMGISKSMGYKIIKEMNRELNADGYITVAGKVSRKYFESRVMI